MKKRIGQSLIIVFTLLLSFGAFSQEKEIIKVSTQKLNDITKVTITLSPSSAVTMEIVKGYDNRTLEENINLNETVETTFEYDFTGNHVYTIFLKDSSGKVIEAESVVTK